MEEALTSGVNISREETDRRISQLHLEAQVLERYYRRRLENFKTFGRLTGLAFIAACGVTANILLRSTSWHQRLEFLSYLISVTSVSLLAGWLYWARSLPRWLCERFVYDWTRVRVGLEKLKRVDEGTVEEHRRALSEWNNEMNALILRDGTGRHLRQLRKCERLVRRQLEQKEVSHD